MYEAFYNLKAEPFRLSPDHKFCYEHKGYARARAYMAYAFMRAEGFVMITGRPGTGKTTLVGELVENLARDGVSTANLVCTQLGADDLLRTVAYQFGVQAEGVNKAELLQRLSLLFQRWHRDGRRALLVVDEAQDLSVAAMEELRLLTNIQRDGQPLLQIFLLGQPELRELVLSPEMEQVHQRIVAASHLEGLAPDEVEAYVLHRLEKVGWQGDPAISKAVFPLIHKFSDGIPRRINLICSRLFLHAGVEQRHKVGVEELKLVIGELQAENLAAGKRFSREDFDLPSKNEWAQGSGARQQAEEVHAEVRLRAVNDNAPPVPESRVPSREAAAKKKDAPGAIAGVPSPESGPSTSGQTLDSIAAAARDGSPKRAVQSRAARAATATDAAQSSRAAAAAAEGPPGVRRRRKRPAPPETATRASATESARRGPGLWWLIAAAVLLSVAVAGYIFLPLIQGERDVRDLGLLPGQSGVGPSSSESVQTAFPATGSGAELRPPPGGANDTAPATGSGSPQGALVAAGTGAELSGADTAEPYAGAVTAPAGPAQEESETEESMLSAPASVADAGAGQVTAAPATDRIASPVADSAGVDAADASDLALSGSAPVPGLDQPLLLLVGFAFDSVALSDDALAVLAEAASILNERVTSSAQITGFADQYGDAVYNLDLSRDRARAVAEYLVAAGVERQRLSVEGRGVLAQDGGVDIAPGDSGDDAERYRIVQIKIFPEGAY